MVFSSIVDQQNEGESTHKWVATSEEKIKKKLYPRILLLKCDQ